jgi:coatomer subunit alpha
MLVKFESKSNRVKGIAFHPTRPWVLASLHNGSIQLWDIRVGTLLDRFDEHEGPVRGVHFHPTQPLFVSGGDDYKVKVFNFKLRRCIFTLIGHLDYIRTVYFHHESPWIVSASDDQTVRLWNWQNRTCLAVLTGHSHYVMSAQFSPNEDLVVSASLDQTVRCWDISALREKSVHPTDVMSQVRGQLPAAVNADLFGGSDAVVKYVLEGHTRGVNWASFHPTLPLIISGADDRQVKLWRMSDTKAWELDTFRGHLNNVSSAIFHPRKELVITNSEDRTIRVWDLNRRTCLQTFRREADRFWILTAHPTVNLLAAGHDSGLIVFKLERERPAYAATDINLVYVKDRFLRILDFNNGRDMPLIAVRAASASMFDGLSGPGGFGGPGGPSSLMYGLPAPTASGPANAPPPRSMSYNQAEHAVLLNFDTDGGTYELYTSLPRSGSNGAEAFSEPRRGSGTCAVFVGRNRFACLEKGKEIVVRDLRNQVTKRIPVTLQGADGLYGAGSGYVLVRSEDKVALHDLQQRKVVAEISASAKYVVWSEDMKRVALLGKHVVVLCTSRLELLATVHETIRVKSAAWDDSGVLLYTTLNHLKYCLPNGDHGIVSTLAQPIYLTRVRGPAVCYVDREGNPGILPIDPTEYAFKLLLLRKRYDDVKRIISQNRLRGQAIIAYLQQKGFPEVALHFVRDEKTRLALALDSGAIDVAHDAAIALDDPNAFRQLADVALVQGNLDVVEKCLQKVKDMDRLAFLYVITGRLDKLATVGKIAEGRGNLAAYFQISMYLGDVEGRIGVLKDCGQGPLARLTAESHGLADMADLSGTAVIGEKSFDSAPAKTGNLLLPPIPVGAPGMDGMSWPHLPIARGLFTRDPGAEGDFEEPIAGDFYEDAAALESSERDATWDDDHKENGHATGDPFAVGLGDGPDGGGGGGGGDGDDAWGGDFDIDDGGEGDVVGNAIDFGDDEFVNGGADGANGDVSGHYYVPPTSGPGVAVRWTRNSALPGELVASGAFDEAMKLLAGQIGASSFTALKEPFMVAYIGARGSLGACPNVPDKSVYFSLSSGTESPARAISLPLIRERFRAGQQKFQAAKFAEASHLFASVIAVIPLLVLTAPQEVEDAKEALAMSREYLIGLRLEAMGRKAKVDGNTARQVQTAGLFSKCGMSPVHIQLALRAAMKTAYDTENLTLAAGFARRLLDLSPAPQLAQNARKVMQVCDRNMVNKDQVDYDERREFVVECATFGPLYGGAARSSCPYCSAFYPPESEGSLCAICSISKVVSQGSNSTSGLRIRA